MEIDVLNREEQALMDREEIEVEISHPGEPTPSAAAIRDRVSAELDLDPKTVEITGIHSSTGLSVSTGTIRVHDEPIHDELPEAGGEDDTGDEEEAGEETEEASEEEEDAGDGEADEDESAEDEAADEEKADEEDDAAGEDADEEEPGEEGES